MTTDEAEWIRAGYVAFRRELIAELGRHPGAPLDDRDMELVAEFMTAVRAHGRTGHRIVHYEDRYRVGVDAVIFTNGAPNVLRWIRDQRFRPKMHEVRAEAERVGMVGETVVQTGETAAQRTHVVAPPSYRAIGSLDDLPQPQMPAEPPSWLDRFPATGNPRYDRVMMTCLLHCSEGKAHATIDQMARDNAAKQRRRDDAVVEADRKRDVRMRRTLGDDAASTMLRLFEIRRATV